MRTNRKDFIPNSPYRKYREINNPDGTKSFEDVTTYSQTGDVVAAADLNELSQNAVWPLSYSKSGNVHSLSGMTGASGMVSIVFRAGDRFNVGDKFAIDGVAYQPRLSNGELPETNTFALGTTVSAIADTTRRTINFKSAGSGIKLPANALVHIARYTADGTFVVPMDGKYRITVVGHGGKGSTTNASYNYYGAGGGAGGACMSEKYLKKEQTYTITVNAGQSSFGNLLTAIAGQDAGADNVPGMGGDSSGGDICYTGGSGQVGWASGGSDEHHGGDGGSYAASWIQKIPVLPYYGGKGGRSANTYSGIRNGETLFAGLCAIGAGGGGGALWGGNTGTGAPGSSGAVIVEYIVPNPSVLTVRGDHIEISGSANAPFVGFNIYGKTMQDGVPTPEKPVPLVSAGDKGSVKISITGDGVPEQSFTLSTPNSLPGIPVPSGGNYTDSTGQQWICDEIDLERGVYIQRLETVSGGRLEKVSSGTYTNRYSAYHAFSGAASPLKGLCTHLKHAYHNNDTPHFYCDGDNITAFLPVNYPISENKNSIYFLAALETPIEKALSSEENSAYKALRTNYPTTTIFNDENAWMSVSCQIKE